MHNEILRVIPPECHRTIMPRSSGWGGAGEVLTSCARKEVKASVDKSVLFSWNWGTAAVGSYFFFWFEV